LGFLAEVKIMNVNEIAEAKTRKRKLKFFLFKILDLVKQCETAPCGWLFQ
jgi:hypothetical protein